MSPCGICGKETGAAASSFCQSCKAIFSGSSGVSQKSLAVILGALLSGSQKTVGMYEDEDEDDYYDQPKAQGIKDRIDNLKERRDRVLTQKHQGLSNIQCKILGPFFTHFKADVKAGAGVPMERTKSAEAAGLEKGHLSFRDMRRLSSRCFRIARDLLAEPGFGKDVGATSYLSHILKGINDAAGDEVVAAIHSDGDGHCLVHAVSRCLAGQEFFWHALRTDLWWRLKTDRHLYLENLPKPLRELYSDENFREWSEIVAEADPKYVPPAGAMLGLQPVHLFGLANILRRPIVLFDGLNGGECGVYLPTLTAPENTSTKKLLAIAWANSARNHFCAVVPIEGQRCLIPKRLLPQNENGVIVWGDEDDSRLAFYVDLVPSGREGDEELYVEVGPGSDEKAASFDAAVRIMEKEFQKMYAIPTSFVCEVFLSQPRDVCSQLNQLDPGVLLKEIHTMNVFYCPICTFPILTEKSAAICSHCNTKDLRPFDKVTGKYKLKNGDRVRTETPIGYGCCGFKHYFDGKEYDVTPVAAEVMGEKVLLKFANSDGDLNTSDSDIDVICHEGAMRACEGDLGHYDEYYQKVKAYIAKYKTAVFSQVKKHIEGRGYQMELEPIPKSKPVTAPTPAPAAAQTSPASAPATKLAQKTAAPLSPSSKAAATSPAKKPTLSTPPAAAAAPPAAVRSGQIRFTFPDGSNATSEFPSDAAIVKLFDFASAKLATESSNLTLSGGWPPKPLSVSDERTLAAAQLLDSSVRVSLVASASSQSLPTATSSAAAASEDVGSGRSVIRNGVLIRAPTQTDDDDDFLDTRKDRSGPQQRASTAPPAQGQRGVFGMDSLRGCGAAGPAEKKLNYQSLPPYEPSQLRAGGLLYEIAKSQHGLAPGRAYTFLHIKGVKFEYDAFRDALVVFDPFAETMKQIESMKRQQQAQDSLLAIFKIYLERMHGPLVHGRVYKYLDSTLKWDAVRGSLILLDSDETEDETLPESFSGKGFSLGSAAAASSSAQPATGGRHTNFDDDDDDDWEEDHPLKEFYEDLSIATRRRWHSETGTDGDRQFSEVVASLSRSASGLEEEKEKEDAFGKS